MNGKTIFSLSAEFNGILNGKTIFSLTAEFNFEWCKNGLLPAETLLATSNNSGRDVAVYTLPSLQPSHLGRNGHKDGILDLCWLDDTFLVSGGYDR